MSTLCDRLPDLLAALAAGQPVALATLFHVKGSAPASVGARLLLDSRGQVSGTVGGGCLDGDVLLAGRRLLTNDGGCQVVEVDLTGREAHHALSCGGIARAFVEPLALQRDSATWKCLAEALEQRQPAALVTLVGDAGAHPLVGCKQLCLAHETAPEGTRLSDPDLARRAETLAKLALSTDRPRFEALDTRSSLGLFAEPLQRPELLILGAGHIGEAVARLGQRLGWRMVVADDRETFANSLRFPHVDEVVVTSFDHLADRLEAGPSTCVLIVTRGHREDARCLRWALSTDARWLGMIGSKAKLKRLRSDLTDQGVAPDAFARLHTPVGLEIGALTVEEIAVSIVAELVRVRRLGDQAPKDPDLRPRRD